MASPRLWCWSNLCLHVREGGNFVFHFFPWCISVFSWWISGQFKSGNSLIKQSSHSLTLIFSSPLIISQNNHRNPLKAIWKWNTWIQNKCIYLFTTIWRNFFTMCTCMSFHCIQNAIFYIVYMSAIATAAKTVLTLTLDQLLMMVFQDPAEVRQEI